LLWWAGPVSFVLPLIAFFLFFFSSIFLCCHFSSSKQYGVASPHKRLRVVREGEGGECWCCRGRSTPYECRGLRRLQEYHSSGERRYMLGTTKLLR
jgi:hypothetical protein